MKRKISRVILALVLVDGIIVSTQPLFACGPSALDAVFAFHVHPEFPLEQFAKGEIGVLQPTYARSYLFVAYRYLNGTPLSKEEQQAVVELWNDRMSHAYPEYDSEWPKVWIEARKKIPGVAALTNLDVYRHREKPLP